MFSFFRKRAAGKAAGFTAAAKTDKGLVRRENQDAHLCRPADGFFCVADGMGGGQGGALASRWICEAFAGVMDARAGRGPEETMRELTAALGRVNARIRLFSQEKGYRMMGSTVAWLLADPKEPAVAAVCHAGDSRVYRLRDGDLQPLTADHTVGNELGRTLPGSAADRAQALQSRRNPLTHILTRAVGTELQVRPDTRMVDVRPGDRFLLCSDGVHDMLSDDEIRALLRRAASPQDAVDALETAVRAAGAADNYTLVCTDCR